MTLSEIWQNFALLVIIALCVVVVFEIRKVQKSDAYLQIKKLVEDVKNVDTSKINDSIDKIDNMTNTICKDNNGYLIKPFNIYGTKVGGIKIC